MLRPLLPLLALLALAAPSRVEPAQALGDEQEFDFSCNPVRLYRGDTLTVTFHSTHDGAELAIRNPDSQTAVVSFKRAPEDKVESAIPHEKFSRMNQIKIDTATARGSIMKGWVYGKTRAVLEPPQSIFTKTGNYDVLVGTDLRSPNGGIDICYMYYYDSPRPVAAGHHQAGANEPSTR